MVKTIEELFGKTLVDVERVGNNRIIFVCDNGDIYKMYHKQECCEQVEIDDVIGDLNNLIGSQIVLAEETSEGISPRDKRAATATWTFYKFATAKGYVTIRWYGESNGWYSERADIIKINCKEENQWYS